jgi:hypothetical protein
MLIDEVENDLFARQVRIRHEAGIAFCPRSVIATKSGSKLLASQLGSFNDKFMDVHREDLTRDGIRKTPKITMFFN